MTIVLARMNGSTTPRASFGGDRNVTSLTFGWDL
jgi:hypothetical protein